MLKNISVGDRVRYLGHEWTIWSVEITGDATLVSLESRDWGSEVRCCTSVTRLLAAGEFVSAA
jgi:hypothetical protein